MNLLDALDERVVALEVDLEDVGIRGQHRDDDRRVLRDLLRRCGGL